MAVAVLHVNHFAIAALCSREFDHAISDGAHACACRGGVIDAFVLALVAQNRVIAHAVTEWSVAFKFDEQERNAVRYVRPVAKRRIDAETGEILNMEHA